MQKSKKEEIRSRTIYSVLYLLYIGAAYALNFNRVSHADRFASESKSRIARIILSTKKSSCLSALSI